MQSIDSDGLVSHSFIVKIWLEESLEEAERVIWRGHITHVSNGSQRYVKDLSEIPQFIFPYLEMMGVRPGLRTRVIRWLGDRLGPSARLS